MKKIYLFIGLALSMLAGGCSKDDPIDNPVGPVDKDDVTVKVTATIAEEGLLWSEGATVAINGFESSALATGGEAAATFEIKNVSAPLKVVAPFKAYGAGDVVTVPDTQKYVAGGYDADAFVMYGYAAKFVETEESEETEENKTAAAEVEMHAACGIVKLPVAIAEGSATISSISLTAANDEAVAGSWKFDFTNGAATAEKVFSTVALDCGENGVALGASAVDFRFVIPAAAYAKGVIIEAATTDGHKFVRDYTDALTVVAGAETALETMNFEIIEKADATLNITIAEPAITWAAGDEVVVNGVLSSALADEDAGKSTASFELKEVAHPYTVLYPRDLYTTSGRLRFYDEQRLLKNEFDREALAMVGYSFDTDITLHNVCGLIKIPVFNNFEGEVVTLEKVCIRSNDGSPLAGKYNINYRNATLSLVSAVDTMTLVPEEGSKGIEIPIGEKIYVYAIVPEGRFPAGLTIDVYTDVENQMDILCTPAGGLNVTRGVETELETVEYTDVKIEAITTAEEFVEFGKAVNGGRYKKFVNSDGEVALGADIDMSGVEWTEISGLDNAGFDGIFNGKGFAIKNWSSEGVSLFTKLAATGVIKDIVLDSSCMLRFSSPLDGDFGFIVRANYGIVSGCVNNAAAVLSDGAFGTGNTGIMVGYSYLNSRVENCTNNANLTITAAGSTVGTNYIGTVNGRTASASDGTTEIYGCTNNGTVTITITDDKTSKNFYIGGVTGSSNSYTKTTNCTNTAAITFSTPKSGAAIIMGGVTPYSAGDITGCINSGAITLSSDDQIKGTLVGGISGYQQGATVGCENSGNIELSAKFFGGRNTIGSLSSDNAISTPCNGVGGIVGQTFSSSNNAFSMDNCKNGGNIKVVYRDMTGSTLSKDGRFVFGGLVGDGWGNISNSSNSGSVNVAMNGANGTFAGSNGGATIYAGGIAGSGYYSKNQTELNITNCHNTGDVFIHSDNTNTTNHACGGIVGWPGKESGCTAVTKDCSNSGNVTAEGNVKTRIGGIQGGSGRVENCINRGVIRANGGSASAAGGIAGFHSNTYQMTDCENYGNVISGKSDIFPAGLIGQFGNVDNKFTTGCKVNCTVQAPAGSVAGMLVASFNGDKYVISIGTEASPCQVAGALTIGDTTTTITSAELTKEYMFGATSYRDHHDLFVTLLQ